MTDQPTAPGPEPSPPPTGQQTDLLPTLLGVIRQTLQAIHDYFGYKEDWVTIPLEDLTDQHWFLTGDGSGGPNSAHLVYSAEPLTKEVVRAGRKIYSGPVYTQRFLPRWVYRTERYTLVSYDTRTDGNKYLAVLDNARECHDPTVVEVWRHCWGS